MNYLSATKIHDGRSWLPGGSVLAVSDEGIIGDVCAAGDIEAGQVAHYDGILCPGFVNVHCHLELSHLKGKIPEKGGLLEFIQSVIRLREQYGAEAKEAARLSALDELKRNGTIALGDIANSTDTLQLRPRAEMHIHTFIEALGFPQQQAGQRFDFYQTLYRQFAAQHKAAPWVLHQSIVPHAPYSVSEKLFSLINDFGKGQVLSMHNQETPAENTWYQSKTGAFRSFYESLSVPANFFKASGKTSLQTCLPWLNRAGRLILVHNTCMSEADIRFLKTQSRAIFLCLCPNANLYIEDRLPSVTLMDEQGLDICLGTDSLAANHQLSILAEIRTIQKHFPELSMEKLIRWATWNGARALQLEEQTGAFLKGKQPGVLLLSGDRVRVLY